MTPTYFLHGLDSSGSGTKGRFFQNHFPEIHCPNFHGSLTERMKQLEYLCKDEDALQFIGSSYGGLMATCFSINNHARIKNLVLLAPALNFEDFIPPRPPISVPTLIVVGQDDTVTPANSVLALARKSFSNLTEKLVLDDHLLHKTYTTLNWVEILNN